MNTTVQKLSKVEQTLKWVASPHSGEAERELLNLLDLQFGFTLQQLRQALEWWLDTKIWQESHYQDTVRLLIDRLKVDGAKWTRRQLRDHLFSGMRKEHDKISAKLKEYPNIPITERHPTFKFEDKQLKGDVKKLCPAASERGVCCGLQTLNIVENCAMGCSYCVLQGQYDEALIKVPDNLSETLDRVYIDPNQRQRVCTGEYSDSLLWGNKNNMLDDLMVFAKKHPNMVLELKTKSIQIDYLLKNEIPRNVVVSWSINTPIVIEHEERRTPPVEERLKAARAVADKGIGVAFHLHPMIYYQGFELDYQVLIESILKKFEPRHVLWFSLGTITYPRGLESELRKQYTGSKIWQMETEMTPDEKVTYAYPVRREMYANALKALSPWKDKVYMYMCMEFHDSWQDLFGFSYPDMQSFNDDMNRHVYDKLGI